MRTRRATVLLWGGAVVLVVVSGIAFWIEWERAALPVEDELFPHVANLGKPGRMDGAPAAFFNGWEFRLFFDVPREGALWYAAEPDPRHPWTALPALFARPSSSMAKLRYLLGAFRAPWRHPPD